MKQSGKKQIPPESSSDEDTAFEREYEELKSYKKRTTAVRREIELATADPLQFPDYFLSSKLKPPPAMKNKSRTISSQIAKCLPDIFDFSERKDEEILEENKLKEFALHIKAGFNILICGIGSKFLLMKELAINHLSHYGEVIFVNGALSSGTLKDLLNHIIELIQKKITKASKSVPASMEDKLTWIENNLVKCIEKKKIKKLILVIHCLDIFLGSNQELQNVVCQLATFHKLHLCCSIDNTKYFTTWNSRSLSDLSFIYLQTELILHYEAEECYFLEGFTDKRKQIEEGFFFIVQSLPKNVKKILQIIINEKVMNPESSGFTFEELFKKCQYEMIIAKRKDLKDLLLCVKDHNILVEKVGADSTKRFCLNYPNSLIPRLSLILSESQIFLQQMLYDNK